MAAGGLQLRIQGAGGLAGQDGQAVHRLADLLLVGRQLGAEVEELGALVLHVQLGDEALAALALGQVEDVLGGLDVLALRLGKGLGAAQAGIGLGHLGLEGDEGVVDRFGLCLGLGLALFHRAADASEEVELPGGVEAGLEEVDGAVQLVDQGVAGGGGLAAQPVEALGEAAAADGALQAELLAGVAAGAVEAGQAGGAGGGLALAGLDDAQDGLLQVEVAADRAFHQRGEDGVVEAGPPARVGIGPEGDRLGGG
ncbi:hypothetical protein MHL32_24855, partial [Roseomonas mucosa]